MADRIEVAGLARLKRTMRQAGADIGQLKDLNRRAASTAAPAVRAATPVGPAKSGHLHTTVRVGATGKAGVIRVGNKSKPYAGPIHWGWPKRNIRPNPWAAEAARSTEGAWTEVYVQGIEQILSQIEGA